MDQDLKNNDLFEIAFTHASIGMALVGLDGQWLKVNKALSNLLGYSFEELTKLTFQDITHPDDLAADLNYLNETLQGHRQSYQMEKRYITKGGDIVWAILSVSLIRNPDGSPKFFISQIQDITQLKLVQKELQANMRKSALWEMSVGIAHEINNPLTIISLNAKLLDGLMKEPAINRELAGHFISKIRETAMRMDSILNRLKKYTRPASYQEPLQDLTIESILKDN